MKIHRSFNIQRESITSEIQMRSRLPLIQQKGFPDLKHNIVEQVAADDKVVTRWVATGTHSGNFMGVAPTGKRVEFAGINVYTIDHRLFAQSQVNWDLLSLFRQIGAATVNANLDVG